MLPGILSIVSAPPTTLRILPRGISKNHNVHISIALLCKKRTKDFLLRDFLSDN
jgi:hypothetical protein